jgi:hypothetical protein
MKNIAIRYGLIAAGIFVAWTLLEHVLGLNTVHLAAGEKTRLASAFIFYLLIFLCLRAKKKSSDAVFTYMDAIKTGSLMVIVYSAITAAWLAIYQNLLNPEMHVLMVDYTRQKMEHAGATEEQMAQALEQVDVVYSGKPFSFIMYFVFSSIVGIVVTGIFGFFFKTRK